jgi:hypothetical protein
MYTVVVIDGRANGLPILYSPVLLTDCSGQHAGCRMIGSADFPKVSQPRKRAFLTALSRCGSISQAVKRAKVDRRTHYNWLKDDPWYVDAFRQALFEAGDSLQDNLCGLSFRNHYALVNIASRLSWVRNFGSRDLT